MSALDVQGIEAGYGARSILHGIDLTVGDRGSLTVVGPNGSGKSTLMKVVVGLIRPSRGRIRLLGEDVTGLAAPARARRGVGYVPQEANVFRNMSVRENLKLGFEFIPSRQPGGFAGRLEAMLDLFPELADRLGTLAGHLSGGQRQMVAMAAALMPAPALLALDEPSAGLSPRNAGLLFAAIARIVESGVAVFMIEQNTRLGLGAVEDGLVLVAGQVRARAPARALLADPEMRRLYLGAEAAP
ncbi:MAG: ATP-binding cassette domain-containing protein [Parafilimonas terrae]|nr:ATP-binding cassette domain-containing protein [Parafilimonas terrae]